MKIVPPKQIMKYVSFKNGVPVAKEGMPEELTELFNEYIIMCREAKASQQKKLEQMGVNIKDNIKDN